MFLRWIDPHTRRSVALAAVVLSVTGLVLADRGGGTAGPSTAPLIARDDGPSATALPIEGGGVRGRFAVSHGRLLASGTRSMYAEIRVRAEEASDVAEARAPVAMVLVIDTSGSMAGQKIEDARRAAIAVLDEMQPDDLVSVVRFATQAEVLVPLSRVADVRVEARRQIERLKAIGNTDIANALRNADRVLGWTRDGRIGRIVLVTDGRDTSGAPRSTGSDVARAEASRGFTVSALGIGTDFDDAYLASISDAGRGNYEFLRDTTALARFLSKELREATRTRVRNLEAHLTLPPDVRIRDVWGATWDGNRLSFGSLFAGDERRAVVSLEVSAGAPGSSIELGGSLSWRSVDGSPHEVDLSRLRVTMVKSPQEVDEGRDMSVVASATSVIASKRETEAAMAFERGDRARALELNAQNRVELDKVRRAAPPAVASQLDAQKRAYEGHQGTFATAPPSPTTARDIGAQERKNADRSLAY
ncbi:MAG TPA: VWA domain-containing protein [Polyangiaceae bacterium]